MFIFVNTLLEAQISPRIVFLTSNSSVKNPMFFGGGKSALFFYPINEDYSLFQIKMGLKVFNFICENGHTFEAMGAQHRSFEEQKRTVFSHVPCVIRMSFREPPFCASHPGFFYTKGCLAKYRGGQCIPSIKRSKKILDESNLSGDRFADEARSIHRGDAPDRLITGTRPRKRYQNSGMKELKS